MLLHWTPAKASFTPRLIIFQKPRNFLWAGNKPFSALRIDSIIHSSQSLHQPTENGQEYTIVIYLNDLHFRKGLNTTEPRVIFSFLNIIGISSACVGRLGGLHTLVAPQSPCSAARAESIQEGAEWQRKCHRAERRVVGGPIRICIPRTCRSRWCSRIQEAGMWVLGPFSWIFSTPPTPPPPPASWLKSGEWAWRSHFWSSIILTFVIFSR